ncbi:unnamed protein product [Soboliphyme baturini]|uniref:MFS domain-containing protein n=1 Tax=Soboliphyme baturini TaxID=241478 RepID=A0A183IBE3_9BILA|nr:unnamed protein product [Soboliphyme baturini]
MDLAGSASASPSSSRGPTARRKATMYRKFTVEQLGPYYNSIPDVMNAVGSFGKYQIFCCFVLSYSSVLWTADYAFVYQNCSTLTPVNVQFFTVMEEFKLICARKFYFLWLFTGYLCGHLLGCCLGGLSADLFGRLSGFFATLTIGLVSNVMSIASRNWTAFIAFQIVNGIAMGKMEVNSLTLFIEFTEESFRLVPIAVFQSGVAFLVVSLIAFLTVQWRYYFIFVGLISAPLMYLHLVFRESPRWLLVRGNADKAAEVLSEIASDRWNKKNLTIVPAQLLVARNRIRRSSSLINAVKSSRRVLFLFVQILSSFKWSMVNNFLLATMGNRLVGIHFHLLINGLVRVLVPIVVITAFYKVEW